MVLKLKNAFQRISDNSGRKANKIWANKGGEFCIRSMTSWQQDNDRGTYSTHNEEKCVITERFIRTLKNKIYEYMTSMSKNEYIDKLDIIVNEYNKTYHSTVKIKPDDIN